MFLSLSVWVLRIKILVSLFYISGNKGQHEALIPSGDGATIYPMSEAGKIQETVVCALLLSFCTHRETEIPNAWMEYHVWLQ